MAQTRSSGVRVEGRKPDSSSATQPPAKAATKAAPAAAKKKKKKKKKIIKQTPTTAPTRRPARRRIRPTTATVSAALSPAAPRPPAAAPQRRGVLAEDVIANPGLFNLQDPEALLRRARRSRVPREPVVPAAAVATGVQQQSPVPSAARPLEIADEARTEEKDEVEKHDNNENQDRELDAEEKDHQQDVGTLASNYITPDAQYTDDQEDNAGPVRGTHGESLTQQTASVDAAFASRTEEAAAKEVAQRKERDAADRVADERELVEHEACRRKAAERKAAEPKAREDADRELAERGAAERQAQESREKAKREAAEREEKMRKEMIAEFAALEAKMEARRKAEAHRLEREKVKKEKDARQKAEEEMAQKEQAAKEQAERKEAERGQSRKAQAAREEIEKQKLANQQHGRPADFGMSDFWRKQRADSDAARADALKRQEQAEKIRKEKEDLAKKEAAGGFKKAGKRPAEPTPTVANKKPRFEEDEDDDKDYNQVKGPNTTDKSSCMDYTQAEQLANFKFDRLNTTPAVEMGKPLQLDVMFQALAAITEAINDCRVAQQQSKLYSLFHPRSLLQPSFIDHPAVLVRHNALIPIERRTMGKTHYSLIELLQTHLDRNISDGRVFFDMRHYDCVEIMRKAFETTFATKSLVRSSIIKTGWAGRTDVPPDSILMAHPPMKVCERMHDQEWAVGIHVVLNGWVCALGLKHNVNALLSKHGFYNRAVALINYALHGLVGSKMILDFFDCYEYTLPDTLPAEARKSLTFKECKAFPTYASLDRQIGIYTGRIGARELERQRSIDHAAMSQPEPVEQHQQPFLQAFNGSPHRAQPLPGLSTDAYFDPSYNAPAEPMYDPDTISSQPARTITSFDQGRSQASRSEADIFADIFGDLADTTPGLRASKPAATTSKPATQQESGVAPEMSKEDRKILEDAKKGKVNEANEYAKGEDASFTQNRGFNKTSSVKPKKIRVVDNDPDADEAADLPDEAGYDSARSSDDDDFDDNDDLDDEGKLKPVAPPTSTIPDTFSFAKDKATQSKWYWRDQKIAEAQAEAKKSDSQPLPARIDIEDSVELEDPDDMDLFDEPEPAPEPRLHLPTGLIGTPTRLHLPGPPPPTPHFPVMPPPPPPPRAYVPSLKVPVTTLTTPQGSVAPVEAPVMKLNTGGTFEAPDTPEETPTSSNESLDGEHARD